MRIYLDNIVFQLQKAGGISVYWAELVKRLISSDHKTTFIEQYPETNNIFRNYLNIDKAKVVYEKRIPIKLLRYLPLQLAIDNLSVFHSSYYRVSTQKQVINILTVHDFIYEYFSNGLRSLVHSTQKRSALKAADGIICVSKNTKSDLLKFYPWVDEKKVKVIYNGVGEDFFPVDRSAVYYNSPIDNLSRKKYILYIGSRSNYKNFTLVVDIMKQLPDCELVIIGGNPLNSTEELNLKSKLHNKYVYLGNINDHELNILYNFAHCLLYPSSYEGFGIPPLEAMKAGCPVVTTNAASIPEVVGNAGLIVDPHDVIDVVEKINSLENIPFRNDMINAGFAQAQKFSWDKCFDETIGFYEQMFTRRTQNP